MNGTITVESVLGEGSAFTVTLPFEIDKHPSAQAANGAADETALHGLKVLLAEDNELNMEIAEFFLEDMGAETMQAWNGKEAVEAFRNSAPGERCENGADHRDDSERVFGRCGAQPQSRYDGASLEAAECRNAEKSDLTEHITRAVKTNIR